MPSKREREYYTEGFRDGYEYAKGRTEDLPALTRKTYKMGAPPAPWDVLPTGRGPLGSPKKRKLSAWNKFVKANSKKPRFIYRTGKLNLKKMAVAFRKTPAGKKKRKR